MAGIVRMTHPRIGERPVAFKQVPRMQQNGWTVADDSPKRRRRSKADDAKPSETDSEGFSVPGNEQEN